MRTRPIIFSTEMVIANLEKRKTQTRRKCYYQRNDNGNYDLSCGDHISELKYNLECTDDNPFINEKYNIGDILWVRETFGRTSSGFVYKASVCSPEYDKPLGGWKPCIHMPKEAARIFFKVTNVRCEKLQDISNEDAIAEGCSVYGPFGEYKGAPHPATGMHRAYRNPKDAFRSIWEFINGKDSWKNNPWVWVYEYERIEKPENF